MTATADTTATAETTTPAPAAAKPPVTVAELPPEALSKRLEQAQNSARTALLAELGITDIAASKAALKAHADAVEAAKSRDLKLAELEVQVRAQNDALASSVAGIVAKITAEQKAAIDAVAGTDPAAWLRTYNALSPTWNAPAPAASAAVAPAPAAAPVTGTAPAPAVSTSVNVPAPSSAGSVSPPNHALTFQRLQKENPFYAGAYLAQHGDACFKP